MSRGYDARRKAKRQQARAAAAEPAKPQSPANSPRPVVLLPILAVVAILVATAILGVSAGGSPSNGQIDHEVTALLAGIPQHGATLGSPNAPVTLQMFSDLECPTVRRFVETYLPSMIRNWIRTGSVKIEYRSLKTDTVDEHAFFRQEEAARAAGRQNKMWNFVLTFVRQQGPHFTEYATPAFLTHIASQVAELDMKQWSQDREMASLFTPIALSMHSAHARNLRSTPSFVMSGSAETSSAQDEIRSSLDDAVQILGTESVGDVPVLKVN